MKKTILAMVLMGSGAAVMAQDSLSVNTDNMNSGNTSANQMQRSTGNYPAYGSVAAPAAVQHSFNQQYPGTTDAQWQRSYNGYWRATYRQNGMPVNVYYADNGQSFTVALPVLQGAVPPEVVAKAIDLYGNSLYDITMVKVKTNDNAWSNNNATMNTNTGNNATMNTNTGNNGMNGTTGMAGNTGTANTTNAGTQNRYIIRVIENGMLRAERMNEDGTPDQTFGTNNANANTNSGSNNMNNGTATMNNSANVNTNSNSNATTTNNNTGGTLNHSGSYSAYYGTTDGSNGSYYGTEPSMNQQSGSNMNQSGNLNNTNNSTNQMNSNNGNSGNGSNSNIDQPATGNLNSTNTNGTKTGTKKTTKKKS